MKISLRLLLSIIGEMILAIAKNLPEEEAFARVGALHGMSAKRVRGIWNNR